MKSLTYAFIVIFYFVCTHINCDINSNFIEDTKSIFNKTTYLLTRKNSVIVPHEIHEKNSTGDNLEIDVLESIVDEDYTAKKCLENITDCMEKNPSYRESTDHLKKYLLTSTPPFDPSLTRGVSPRCKLQSRRYIEDLSKFKFWALNMYDSSAKLPSGLLNGNVNQFGDFDICLRANLQEEDIYGQYCLASFQMEAPESPYLAALHRLLHSHFHFKSRMEDPGHRVPRYSSINWALCVPDSCTAQDVDLVLKQNLGKIFGKTGLKIRSEVEASMCQTARPKALPLSSLIGMSFFVGFAIFVALATLYDCIAIENANDYILAFSLRKNWNSLTKIENNGDIKAVHGVRFMNSFLLILAHKSMAVFFVPYSNRTEMIEFLARPWTIIARAASLYTDPFIMIAGTLTAYSMFGKLQRTNKINIRQEYVNRLFRILPTFAALIGFCTFVLPWIDNGPMWNQVITHHSDICKQYWWRNLLFIHNYFGFSEMCLTHTHHIGIDTQLFFISPFLVLLLWKFPKKGLGLLFSIAVGSTMLRYYVTYSKRLSNYIHFGTSIQQLFDTADNMYILPVHRLTVYIMGILLGYYLQKFKDFRLSKLQIRIGNSVAFLSFLSTFLGTPSMGSIKYIYSPLDAAWYAAFSPIFWCISFGWIIFSVHVGHEDYLGRLFSWPGFRIWTKISYTVYLTQFPIFFYNVGTTRSANSYSFWRTNVNLHEILVIVVASVVLTLLFEMPFQNIRNILLKKTKTNQTEEMVHGKKVIKSQ